MDNNQTMQQDKKPFYKKPWFFVIIAIIVVGVIGGIVASQKLSSDMKKAQNFIASGDYQQAKTVLDSQLQTNPEQGKIYLTYADYYIAQKDYLSAIKILEDGKNKASALSSDLNKKIEDINSSYKNEITLQNQQIEEQKKKDDEERKLQLQQEEERKRQEEEEKKQQQQQEEEQKKQDAIATAATFKSECKELQYEEFNRNPNQHKGEKVVAAGEIIQVMDGILNTTYRINVTKGDFDIWSDTVIFTFKIADGEPRILENDIVKIYGTFSGITSYTSILGQAISVPEIDVKYVEISK